MSDQYEVDQLKRRVAELEADRKPAKNSSGCGAAALIIIGAIVVLVVAVRSCSPGSTATSNTASAPSAPAPSCNMSWSNTTIEAAKRTPLVRDMAVRKDGLHIVVGVPQWRLLTIDQRDQVVSAADCAVAGPGYLKTVIVESPSGVILKPYTYLDLYEARKLQGSPPPLSRP